MRNIFKLHSLVAALGQAIMSAALIQAEKMRPKAMTKSPQVNRVSRSKPYPFSSERQALAGSRRARGGLGIVREGAGWVPRS